MIRLLISMVVFVALVAGTASIALADGSCPDIASVVLPDATKNTYEVTLVNGEKQEFGQRDVNVRFDASVSKSMLCGGQHKTNIIVPNLEELTKIAVKRQ